MASQFKVGGRKFGSEQSAKAHAERIWQSKGIIVEIKEVKIKSGVSPEAIFDEAHAAGMAAGNQAAVVPMVVSQHASPLDDNSKVVQSWFVEGGVCGFAWVRFPGNSKFAKCMKELGRARPAYNGGFQIWVREFGQSMQRKEAYAAAFADVLNKHGIKAFSESRMD